VKLNKIIAVAIPIIALSFIFYGNPLIPFLAGIIALTYLTKTSNDEMQDWLYQTWDFTKQNYSIAFVGCSNRGFALGRPGNEGILPSQWISSLVGGNSLGANFFSSLVGAFMYFATLTEVPIVQGLLGSGMGKGPALALLLAGPALSLPNMLVIKSIMGTKKTIIFVSLVVVLSTITDIFLVCYINFGENYALNQRIRSGMPKCVRYNEIQQV
jgi:uncharacterized membrane protein YraQ (UPF0718 family)